MSDEESYENKFDTFEIPGVDEQYMECGSPVAGVWVNPETGEILRGGIICPACRQWTRCERCRVTLLRLEEEDIAPWLIEGEPVWALKLNAEPTKTEWDSTYKSLRAEARRVDLDLTYAFVKGSNILFSNVDNGGSQVPQDPRHRRLLLRRSLQELNQLLHEGIVSGQPLKGHPIKKSKNLKRRRKRAGLCFRVMTKSGRCGQDADEVRELLSQEEIPVSRQYRAWGGWGLDFELPNPEPPEVEAPQGPPDPQVERLREALGDDADSPGPSVDWGFIELTHLLRRISRIIGVDETHYPP